MTRQCTKRFALLLALMLLLPSFSALAADKSGLPDRLKVAVISDERLEKDGQQYIYKEWLKTSRPDVDDRIKAQVDSFDQDMAGIVPLDPAKKAKRNSRLDVEVNYTRSGGNMLSCLILSRVSHRREQLELRHWTMTFDMETGEQVFLPALFDEATKPWDFLAERVKNHLDTVFPGQDKDEAAFHTLPSTEAIKEAAFTLSGAELTLHYRASELVEGQTGLMHVRFFYPELAPYLSDYGKKATDNSRYKMVALTLDDGPRHFNSINTLNNLRKHGARATFFTVGKLYQKGMEILHREFDSNHIVACHSFNHWSGYSMKTATRPKEIERSQEVTRQVLGEEMKYFRAPGGTYPPWQEANIAYPIIQWSVDTYDFRGASPKRITENIAKNVQEGDIILMHDTGELLHKAVPLFCDWLWENSFMPVTIEELAWQQGVTMQANEVYFRFLDGKWDERRDSNTN